MLVLHVDSSFVLILSSRTDVLGLLKSLREMSLCDWLILSLRLQVIQKPSLSVSGFGEEGGRYEKELTVSLTD